MVQKLEGEGGCGVIGIASTKKIKGKHLLPALEQMCNRGNGKGGGIAAVGLNPKAFNTSQDILENDYLIACAYLDINCRKEVEHFLKNVFEIDHFHEADSLNNTYEIPPPKVIYYFGRVKEKGDQDEIVYQTANKLNQIFYSSSGDKRAFLLSYGKNLVVLKMVGYADDVIRHYKLEEFEAHVWIGHHRFPTRGRVWHPGGAHPFVGVNEALVHNGDFANYFSICEYLAQKNIHPHFLTDTEVAALTFDLLYRKYHYPLEYVIEALAPTTERDFTLLPPEKQKIYQDIQKTHIHGSPDGPWFFIVAQSLPKQHRLIGITDTSMLRPQVFALQKGEATIGLAASEKQAIDATLKSLSEEDKQFWSCADYYWNARGGSYKDGGAFTFTVEGDTLTCKDKFNNQVYESPLKPSYKNSQIQTIELPEENLLHWVIEKIPSWNYSQLEGFLKALSSDKRAIETLTFLIDQSYPVGEMRRSCLQALYHQTLNQCLKKIKSPSVIDAEGLPSEGKDSLARKIVETYQNGTHSFIIFNMHGQRFIGNGLMKNSKEVVIHVFGSSGDYLASGIDGAKIYVHGSGQDALAQIMKEGTLVVYGDVGQTFMYGAKGGKAFIKGNTAGRPLINAVGNPKVVINGTCLDYLAESFMAGNPLKNGGFVIVNGISFTMNGEICELESPYPGNSLFSLASGGAIYIRDPGKKVDEDQLNGGKFAEMTVLDWNVLLPLLEENAELFNIPLSRLLQFEGRDLEFHQVYRKICPSIGEALQAEGEALWVKARD